MPAPMVWDRGTSIPARDSDGRELVNLFRGSGTVSGRYGLDGKPSIANSRAPIPGGVGAPYPYYAQADLDAVDNPTYGPSTRYSLPGEGTNKSYSTVPSYPSASYGNGDPFERTNHPMMFNPFNPLSPPPQTNPPDAANPTGRRTTACFRRPIWRRCCAMGVPAPPP